MSLNTSITINGEEKIEKTWMQQQTHAGQRPAEASSSGGDIPGNHARASGGGTYTSRWSRVRRGNRRCGGGRGHGKRGGGFGGDGSGGGGSAAAKTPTAYPPAKGCLKNGTAVLMCEAN